PVTCGAGGDYVIYQYGSATMIPGTTDVGNHCDDCMTSINLPFPFQLYSQSFNNVNVSSNGTLQFLSNNPASSNSCLPDANYSYTVFAYWDDLLTNAQFGCNTLPGGCGIFTATVGIEPSRTFVIEWRASQHANSAQAVNFEVLISE